MALPTTTTLPAVPRRVVVYGLLLSLSLAILGIFGSRLVSLLDGSYQEIVSRQLPSIALVRAISQANSFGRRMVDSLSVSATPEQITAVEEKLYSMREQNTLRLDTLQGLMKSDEGRSLMLDLLTARKSYRAEVDNFLRELKVGMSIERREYWGQKIADMDTEYVEAQDRLADYCTNSAVSVSEVLSTRSKRLVFYFLLVAAWPLILGGGLFMLGLCKTLVVFYRRNR